MDDRIFKCPGSSIWYNEYLESETNRLNLLALFRDRARVLADFGYQEEDDII
jgi:hypothetical protein